MSLRSATNFAIFGTTFYFLVSATQSILIEMEILSYADNELLLDVLSYSSFTLLWLSLITFFIVLRTNQK